MALATYFSTRTTSACLLCDISPLLRPLRGWGYYYEYFNSNITWVEKVIPPNKQQGVVFSGSQQMTWHETTQKVIKEPKATYPLLPNLQQNKNNNNIFGWLEGSIWWVDVTGCGSPWSRTEEVGHPHWPGSHNQHALCVCVWLYESAVPALF